MSVLLQRAVGLLAGDDGPTAVEYAVLLALIAVGALTTMAMFGSRLQGIYTVIAAAVEHV